MAVHHMVPVIDVVDGNLPVAVDDILQGRAMVVSGSKRSGTCSKRHGDFGSNISFLRT